MRIMIAFLPALLLASGAGKDEQRSVRVTDSLPLAWIEPFEEIHRTEK